MQAALTIQFDLASAEDFARIQRILADGLGTAVAVRVTPAPIVAETPTAPVPPAVPPKRGPGRPRKVDVAAEGAPPPPPPPVVEPEPTVAEAVAETKAPTKKLKKGAPLTGEQLEQLRSVVRWAIANHTDAVTREVMGGCGVSRVTDATSANFDAVLGALQALGDPSGE